MTTPKVDRDKLRVRLRRLRKDALLEVLDRAIDLVPASRLAGLIEGHVDPSSLAPEARRGGALLRAVRTFHEASLRGDYYEDFDVDSKNFMRMSKGTRTWIAECQRLFNRCVDATRTRRHGEARQALEVLFDLLEHVDEGHDDVVFFASEGGSWQVGVDWEAVLPAYFSCLAAAAEPGEYATSVVEVIDAFVRQDRKRYVRRARRIASPAQRRALSGHGSG